MYIVDYSNDYYGSKIETTTFNEKERIVTWVADMSSETNFKLKRINKYSEGRLYPHEISLSLGRITIVPEALEEEEK